MKKLSLILVILLTAAAALSGCGPTGPASWLHDTLPWTFKEPGVNVIEECKYQVIRYLGDCDKADNGKSGEENRPTIVISHEDSYATYTLIEGKSLKREETGVLTRIDDPESTLLIMELKVWYIDKNLLPLEYREIYGLNGRDGTPETIESYTVFDRYYMNTKFTYRKTTVNVQSSGNANHELWVDYTGEITGSKTARLRPLSGASEREVSIKKADKYYDNESIFYLLRAIETVNANGSSVSGQTFNFFLPYENLLAGRNGKKVKPRELEQTTAALPVSLIPAVAEDAAKPAITVNPGPLDNKIANLFNLPAEADKSLIACETTLKLTGKKPGPAIKLYYSQYPVRRNTAAEDPHDRLPFPLSKVLLQVKTYTYGADINTPEFSQVFRLVDYSQDYSQATEDSGK